MTTTAGASRGNDFDQSGSDPARTTGAGGGAGAATFGHDTQVTTEVAQWIQRFDSIYLDARGDISCVPWAHRQPCPSMEAWLNAEAPSLVRPGARAVVVGCGLGFDACALLARGYDVLAFDASPSAVAWAKKLHPDAADSFIVADLLNLPSRLRGRFDLVVEIHTLQALPPACRHELVASMATLLSHRGVLLAVARGRPENVLLEEVDGPPFPFTARELEALMRDVGLAPTHAIHDFNDDDSPPVRRLRGVFTHA